MVLKFLSSFLLVCGFFFFLSDVSAQDSDLFQGQYRVADEVTLSGGNGLVRLWGIESVDGLSAGLKAKARLALEDAIGLEIVQCRAKGSVKGDIAAQCIGLADQDLALLILRAGYGVADRRQVYGSVFEDAYLSAERAAQVKGLGVWAQGSGRSDSSVLSPGTLVLVLGFILFLFVVVTFVIMNIIIRGFEKVSDAQERHSDIIGRERTLKDKERSIVAKMLASEIKANKSKIEAYLIVYEEMLNGLQDPERQPKYKKAGDMVQQQPALDRSVFDRNTDKLDVLGDRLSSEVVHFYARIKTKPDYTNLEPDVPLDEAVAMVEKGLGSARRLNQVADGLIDAFQERSEDDL